MKKIFKELIVSKMVMIIFILSILILLFQYVGYRSCDNSYMNWYDIEHCENITDYSIIVRELNESKTYIDEKSEEYDQIIENIDNRILIYQALENNNVNYTKVYDGISDAEDSSVYILSTSVILKVILVVNIVIIVYSCFTREFDNFSYTIIYTNNRGLQIFKRVLCSFNFTILIFSIYTLLITIFSTFFDKEFSYILVLDCKKAVFENFTKYLFIYYYLQNLYYLAFIFLLIWTLALLFNNTLKSIIAFMILLVVYVLISYLKLNIGVYLGMMLDYEITSYRIIHVFKLFIMLPIFSFGVATLYFMKKDL